MADSDHYIEAADGLQAAAKALRACGVEEAGENEAGENEGSESTPRSKQPRSLRDAAGKARERFAAARGEKPRYQSD